MKKLLLAFFFTVTLCMPFYSYSAESPTDGYTTLRSIDTGTFNEYRYKITEQFFVLRDRWEIDGELNKKALENIGLTAVNGYKYLPDNLKNKNYLRKLITDLERASKYPNSDANYTEVIKSISDYIDLVDISSLAGTIEVTPKTGNAPLNVTLRADIKDPSGTIIPQYNYTWWIDNGGQKVTIGRGTSLNYTFREEGNFSIFLDVTSDHKNTEGNVDVLPFRSRADIVVNEKIASLIVKVNGYTVGDNQVMKFTPNEGGYGLLFDATSSTPTGGARFLRTQWDFGNGVTRSYSGDPRIERVPFGRQGDYTVRLTLETNEGKTVTKEFEVSINDPIATISASQEDGYIGDKFTFSAKPSGNARNLSYAWEVLDIDNDEIIGRKNDNTLTYVFTRKGKFNVRLKVTQANGETDTDTQIVYINSKAPIANFNTKIPLPNKPNRVFLDGSSSFDPDFSDDGKLTYAWFIDGERVNLEDANSSGSVGYYVFDSIGSHDVSLEVRDPDNIASIYTSKVLIDSILSVEMFAFPRVIQRESFIRFVAESPEAEIYEWDFGDGSKNGGNEESINHTFNKSGSFDVKLKVTDADNKSNTFTKTVYVGESDTPVAVLDTSISGNSILTYDENACNGAGAYIGNRIDSLRFDATESINIDGQKTGLEYSWKIGNSKFATSSSVNHKFDEIGCFPVKLTVKSQKNGKTSTREINVSVANQTPIVTSLAINIQDSQADPLIVTVDALGAKDPDGVIQSYLWYYYTDTDTEPQDFRASSKASTTFVLPKITGQYYFVVIMKDNNEARVTSEEVTGSRFFTTVTGDNINTPLIDLSVNDNNVAIGEDVVFTSQVRDILGQNIAKDSKFSWDFDGDGFYDVETSDPGISYKYKKAGTFYAKVKVKHKGLSTTKSITVNVTNKIIPDFEYISIGNTYIFFDTSNGELQSRDWDLGDGIKISGKTFTHEYTDRLSVHNVTLKVSDGTNVKEVTKKVTKNLKNILDARKDGLNLFTVPAIGEDATITLENEHEKVYIYTAESKGEIGAYAIDYDTDIDSDLNGGKNDDADNKGTSSYTSGGVIEIPLSIAKTQNIRIFLTKEDGTLIDSQEIKIVKNYIEERVIDLDSIVFSDVTESEKQKIEDLKKLLTNLPQTQKLTAMNFIQRMQESWSDDTEKTRVIIEFETYLFDQDVENVEEIVNILASLLVEGQADTSEKNVAFNALKNLIPSDIVCTIEGEYETCSAMLIAQLETIRDSSDVEANKTLGSKILTSIQGTETMTNQQKIDFKAILSSLVYGGLANIPEVEVNQVIEEAADTSGGGKLMALLVTIFYWLGIFILVFTGVIFLYFIYYKVVNKDSSLGFQDFIIEKTSFRKNPEPDGEVKTGVSDNTFDILGDIPKETASKTDILTDDIPDSLADPLAPAKKIETPSDSEAVPDWLAGNFSADTSPKTPETLKEETGVTKQALIPEKETPDFDIDVETSIEEAPVPDWLKGDVVTDDVPPLPKQKLEAQPLETSKPSDTTLDESVDEATIPDWLKGGFDEPEITAEPSDAKSEEKSEEKARDTTDDISQTDSDGTVPDWLSGNFGDDEKTDLQVDTDELIEQDSPQKNSPSEKKDTPLKDKKIEKKESILNNNEKAAIPDWLSGSFSDDEEVSPQDTQDEENLVVKKDIPKKAAVVSQKSEKPEKKEDTKEPQVEKTSKKQTPKKTSSSKKKSPNSPTPAKKEVPKKTPTVQNKKPASKKADTELWDDGMKVPDWLKTGDE